MTAIYGIMSKNNKSIGKALNKMQKTLSFRGGKGFFIWVDGRVIEFESEIDSEISKLDGTFGVGINSSARSGLNDGILNLDKGCLVMDNSDKKLYMEPPSQNEIVPHLKRFIEDSFAGFSIGGIVDEDLVLTRDIIGIKPLYFGENEKYSAFATEKKALWDIDIIRNIRPVLPGEILIAKKEKIKSYDHRHLKQVGPKFIEMDDWIKTLNELLIKNITNNLENKEAALLFSGGLDSSLLAQIINNLGIDLQLYCAAYKGSKDHDNSVRIGKILDLPLKFIELTDDLIWSELKKILYHLENVDTVTAEIAAPLFFATRAAHDDGFDSIFAGQGADELFAGYSRYEKIHQDGGYGSLQKELDNDLNNIWQKNILRDDMISMANSVSLILPYLDKPFVEFALKIPPEFKLKITDDGFVRKYILREVGKELGLADEIVTQPKLAVQYGSGSTKGFRRLANRILHERGLDLDEIRKSGFNSPNEFMMNMIGNDLGFPNCELKYAKILNNLSRRRINLNEIEGIISVGGDAVKSKKEVQGGN